MNNNIQPIEWRYPASEPIPILPQEITNLLSELGSSDLQDRFYRAFLNYQKMLDDATKPPLSPATKSMDICD